MFNRECTRCQGTGRYDRGACFQCKGRRFIQQKSKPSLPAHVVEVIFENGSKNIVTMYGRNRDHAVAAVEAQCADKGWKFRITPALFMEGKPPVKSEGPVGIAWIEEYGLTQKLSATILCF